MQNLHKGLGMIMGSYYGPFRTVLRIGFFVVSMIALGIDVAEVANLDTQAKQSASQSNALERVKVLRKQAHNLVSQGKLAQGASILNELISLDEAETFPNRRDIGIAFVDIASTLLPTRDYERLERIFERGIQILQGSRDAKLGDLMVALNNIGAMYDEKGDYQARNRIFSFIVNLAEVYDKPIDADSVTVFLSIGEMYERAGNPKAVAILYGQVHRYMQQQDLAPETRSLWLERYANALVANRQYDEALGLYEQALEVTEGQIPPNHERLIEILASKGNAAQYNQDFSVAEQALDRARRLAEESGLGKSAPAGVVYHNLASLYMSQRRQDKYPDAVKFTELSLEILKRAGRGASSEYALGLNQLAQLAESMGEFDKADQYYQEAIGSFENATDTKKQNFADCLSDFGFFLLRQKKPAGAVTAFERALQVRQSIPNQPPRKLADALSNVATAHFKAGHFKQASQTYWHAITLRTIN